MMSAGVLACVNLHKYAHKRTHSHTHTHTHAAQTHTQKQFKSGVALARRRKKMPETTKTDGTHPQ